jgi:hypothetical protein
MFRLQIELTEKVNSLPQLGQFLSIRRFPSRGENEEDLYEVVSRVRDESVLGEIWKGKANLELGGYVNDEVNLLKVENILGGYYYTVYFKVTKTKLLSSIKLVKSV